MLQNKKNEKNILLALFSAACLLRFFQLTFFEFKGDQLLAIDLGRATRGACFLTTHGISSSIQIYNPPLFSWFMGIVVYFSDNPFYLTLVFYLINLAALFFCLRYFFLGLPVLYAAIASAFIVFSPAFTLYSGNIWAQCLLPLPAVFFQVCIYKLILSGNGYYFLWLAIIAALASQLHLSALYLYPAVFLVGFIYRKKIRIRFFAGALFSTLLIFLPYLYHLFIENGIRHLPDLALYSVKADRLGILRDHLRVASFDFFRYYLAQDFSSILARAAGAFRFILYPLSSLLMVLFIWGLLSYLAWVVKKRRFFSGDEAEMKNYPLPFQIAGFTTLTVTLGYLLTLPRMYSHYLIILFPSYAIMMGFSAWRLWKLPGARVIIAGAILSTLWLLAGTLVFLKNSGGHPHEFGLNYQLLMSVKDEVWKRVPPGYYPEPSVYFLNSRKADAGPVAYVIMQGHKRTGREEIFPLKVIFYWNKQLMRYDYLLQDS